jgi:hypothetical protein
MQVQTDPLNLRSTPNASAIRPPTRSTRRRQQNGAIRLAAITRTGKASQFRSLIPKRLFQKFSLKKVRKKPPFL